MSGNKILWLFRLSIIIAAGLLAVFWQTEALILLVLLVFPDPILRETGLSPDTDERERMLRMQAGYYGFLSAILVIFLVLAWILLVEQKEADPRWYFVLAFPLLVRGSFYTWKNTGMRRLGMGLGFTFGGIWTLFALLSHGFSLEGLIESGIGLSILFATAISLRWPRLGGTLLLLMGIGAALFFTPRWVRLTPFVAVLMFCLMPLPLILAGIALLRTGITPAEDDDGK